MKTRKPKPSLVKTQSAEPSNSEPRKPESLPPVSEPQIDKPNRISFNVTPEGAPDWERMQQKTRTQLIELLQNKAVQKELGISPEQAKTISELGFSDDEANALLDLLGGISAIGASKIYGIPMEVTAQAFQYTPDHRKKVNPPLTRLLNKWGPSALKTWKDEIGCGIILFSIFNTQIRLMHILEEKRKKNLPLRPSNVTPITPAPAPASPAPETEKPKQEKETVANAPVPDMLETVGFNI